MSDLIKVKIGGRSFLCKWEPSKYGSVRIENEIYKTLEYNGRIWTVENLRNDISTNYDVSPYGRLYKYSDAAPSIEVKLPDGWRLPTLTDFNDLVSFLGTSEPLDWISEDFGGTNKNGFNLPMAGYINNSGSYLNYNVRGYVWTKSTYSSGYNYNFYCGYTGVGVDDYAASSSGAKSKLSIRLVKDAT